jgi:hypothetical protein
MRKFFILMLMLLSICALAKTKSAGADSNKELDKIVKDGLKAVDKAQSGTNTAEQLLPVFANAIGDASSRKTKGVFYTPIQQNGVYGQEFVDAANNSTSTFLVLMIASPVSLTTTPGPGDDLSDNAVTGITITRSRLETGK